MRIAMGIVGVLLVLAIIYYFLPQGIKTTIGAVFTGSRSSGQARQNSPSPSLSPSASSVAVNATATVSAKPSVSPSSVASTTRTSPTPTALGSVAGSTTATGSAAQASSTPRSVANAGRTGLPGTGFNNQPPEVTAIQVLACTLLVMVGLKLSRFV